MSESWTDEEIILADELHDKNCRAGCELPVSYDWLLWARDIINDRPQKETLFK